MILFLSDIIDDLAVKKTWVILVFSLWSRQKLYCPCLTANSGLRVFPRWPPSERTFFKKNFAFLGPPAFLSKSWNLSYAGWSSIRWAQILVCGYSAERRQPNSPKQKDHNNVGVFESSSQKTQTFLKMTVFLVHFPYSITAKWVFHLCTFILNY